MCNETILEHKIISIKIQESGVTHMSYIECNNLSLGYDGKAVVEGLTICAC
jgi:uncharacterized protein YlxW (UPF0749 family)